MALSTYRPSVHSSARVAVTTAVPAEPVNPDTNSRRASCSLVYSDWCASPDPTHNAWTSCLARTSRRLWRVAAMVLTLELGEA